MAERSEAKNAERNFASKFKISNILTRSFASCFELRFAQPFLAKLERTINKLLYPQGLTPFLTLTYYRGAHKTTIILTSSGMYLVFKICRLHSKFRVLLASSNTILPTLFFPIFPINITADF